MTYVSMQKYEGASESSRRDSIQFMLLQNVGQIHAQIFFFFFLLPILSIFHEFSGEHRLVISYWDNLTGPSGSVLSMRWPCGVEQLALL